MNAPGFAPPVAMPGSSGGSEPSVAVARQAGAGTRFVSWQNPGEVATSPDGIHFVNRGLPDSGGGGDVTNAIDPSGAFFLGQFCGGAYELHACLERSVDGGATWPLKTNFADMHPGAADRPWVEVYPHTSPTVPWNPDTTRVYLEYHTFSPEELAYVTVSTDGGHTFSPPKLITMDTNALVGSGCNTIPGGVAVDERDGTVYALWLSGNDVASNALTGCNYSQIGPFNKAWVSTSTDGGQTWVSHLAWQGVLDVTSRTGDNADKTFATLAVDSAGQVHVAIPVRHGDDPLGFVEACTANPSTCRENPNDTDLILTTSPDRGAHWTPAVPVEGSFGSYFFPWIASGGPGIVDAVYYKSASRQPNNPASVWYIGFTQVTGAVATYTGGSNAVYTRSPQFTETLLDPNPVHGNGTTGGGICTFGLFCAALMSNGDRSLADSIAITLDPAGGANAVWTDNVGNDPANPNSTAREIHFGCQSSGRGAFGALMNGCYGPADVAVTSAASPDPVAPGGTLTYRLTVTNKGVNGTPSTTSGVLLSDVLPSGVTLVSATPSAGTCSGTATVACDLGILAGDATATVDIAVSVSPGATGNLTNTATVAAATSDPDVSNNTATSATAVSAGGLTALGPARMWVGLANKNDAGIRFDLLAQVFRNGALIGWGQSDGVPAGSTGFTNAVLDTIPLTLAAASDFPSGTTLGYSLSVRNACSGSGQTSGTARLWYGGRPVDSGSTRDAGSRFDATIAGTSRSYFLRSGLALNTVNGTSSLSIDKAVGARCGPFVPFGSWTVSVP
jgi:uncharacterized repeat protein (TIGR01451 family)